MRENFPWEAIAVIAKVLEENSEKYGPADWRKIYIHEHLEHANAHLDEVTTIGNNYAKWHTEDHLAHALCRLAMAVALRERPSK